MSEAPINRVPAPTRRRFLRAAGGAAGVAAATAAVGSAAARRDAEADVVAFFVIGDTHFLADASAPDRLDERSATITRRLVERLNELPGKPIPEASGGGRVRTPFGVIHAGDIIDTGDKQGPLHEAMQRTEVEAFEKALGLTGREGGLVFPIYEVHGNHDGPAGRGPAIDAIERRNATRPRVDHVSPDGLHCAWSVGEVRFINLGIVVGAVPGIPRRRRYAPRGSLDFLVADLRDHVGDDGRPVVVTHHIDMARYASPVPADADYSAKEWDPADVAGFFAALRGHNVAAVFHGHTHARAVWRWEGSACRPAGAALAEGDAADDAPARAIDVFNVDNSSHFAGDAQAFFYVEIDGDGLTVREYATRDGWRTGEWMPLCWRRPPVAAAAARS